LRSGLHEVLALVLSWRLVVMRRALERLAGSDCLPANMGKRRPPGTSRFYPMAQHMIAQERAPDPSDPCGVPGKVYRPDPDGAESRLCVFLFITMCCRHAFRPIPRTATTGIGASKPISSPDPQWSGTVAIHDVSSEDHGSHWQRRGDSHAIRHAPSGDPLTHVYIPITTP
jgi:hypothetical protein